jgi:methyl-accepting chemotaxis protein
MSEFTGKYKRRQLFSNPTVQIKIVLVFGLIAVLFIATNYHIGLRLLKGITHDIMQLPLSADNRSDVILMFEQHGGMLEWQLKLFTFLNIFVLLTGGVLLSHKIGGPLYQLRKYLNEIADDAVEPRKIRFRKSDFFQDIADSFNAFQESKGILAAEKEGDDRSGPE